MKKQIAMRWVIGLALAMSLAANSVHAAEGVEDWKGQPDPAEFHVGALTGLGVIDSSGGFVLLGTASKKIIHSGFAPEINNSVSIEGMAGPIFVSDTSAFMYSAHLRWDFVKDVEWTFYAVGGVGGHITGDSLGNRFLLFPRFGLGTIWTFSDFLAARAEVSHELMAAGISYSL